MTPIRKVAKPIRSRVAISVALRPMRSPYVPKSQAPTGRAAKPMKKMANELRVPVSAADFGKNRLGKTSAAIVP